MAERERRHSCFVLDAVVVVKMDIPVDHLVCFGESGRFVAVNTFCFEDGKEILRHRVVIRIAFS